MALGENTITVSISVVIPAYNEETGIAEVVRGVRERMEAARRQFEIIVVDDGSRDRTLDVARGLGVTVVAHSGNRGYGAALKTGIRQAAGRHILICDADGTYPPESIPMLLESLDGADMVVGSRTGSSVEIPWLRRVPKLLLRRLAMYLAEAEIPDLNSGLRVFSREAVLEFFPILPSGFSFTTTITMAMLCNERAVRFVPINYSKRQGRSKIRPIRDTLNFLILIMRTILYFNPLRVFLPVSLAAGLACAASLAYDLWILRDLTEKTLIFLFGAVQLLAIGVLADLITKRHYGGRA